MSLTWVKYVLWLIAYATILLSCKQRHTSDSSPEALGMFFQNKSAGMCVAPKDQMENAEFSKFFETLKPADKEKLDDASIVVSNKDYYPRVKSILANVPLGLLQWYFTKGGRLWITSNVSDGSSCKPTTESETFEFFDDNQQLAGCVTTNNSKGGLPAIFVLVPNSSTTYEAQMQNLSNIVQGFAVLTGFYLTEMTGSEESASNSLTYRFDAERSELAAEKSDLGFFFLEDVTQRESQKGFEWFKVSNEFKSLVPAQLWMQKDDRDGRYNAYLAWKETNLNAYQTYINTVFAIMMEAEMCNNASRNLLNGEQRFFSVSGQRWSDPRGTRDLLWAALKPIEKNSATGTADVASASDAGLSLASEGRPVLTALRAIITAPVVVGRFAVETVGRPIVGFFSEVRPIRTIAVATTGVVRGVANGAGRAVVGTTRVAGQIVALPFRGLGALFSRN